MTTKPTTAWAVFKGKKLFYHSIRESRILALQAFCYLEGSADEYKGHWERFLAQDYTVSKVQITKV